MCLSMLVVVIVAAAAAFNFMSLLLFSLFDFVLQQCIELVHRNAQSTDMHDNT